MNLTEIAIGLSAGISQGPYAIAIGRNAGNTEQLGGAIAIGTNAGNTEQLDNAIAIGTDAGYTNQGQYSIAIGYNAGNTDQPANSIILNASGVSVDGSTANAFFVKPIRADNGGVLPSGFFPMAYNPTTSEIIYWT